MRDFPTGEQLLETARALLRERLMPALPADRRHEALMIANAMSIAMRQLAAGDEPERRELKALAELLVDDQARDAAAGGVGAREPLIGLNRRLCASIRSGDADGDAVRAHLMAVARQRVDESNPKYLGKGAGRDEPSARTTKMNGANG